MIPAVWQIRLLFVGATLAALGTAWVWRYQAGLAEGRVERDAAVAAARGEHAAHLARVNALAAEKLSAALAERDRQQARADEAERLYAGAVAAHSAHAAALGRDLDRLRGAIAAYAAGGGGSGSAEADLAACRGRAGALGGLLEEALRVSAACAGDGELDRAAARALWDAWP